MKKVLITGANSYIGVSFEKYINERTKEYQLETVNMLDDEWRKKDFSSFDSIFHVAGIAHSDTGAISKEKERLYYAVNTELTIEVANKAKEEGVKQFIFMSSAIVYGESNPIGKKKRVNKETEPSPENAYGDSKLQAEKGLQLLESPEFKVVILRPPMIYGKGSKGNYPILSKIARKFPLFPAVKSERSVLYIENLCEFVYLMIKNNERGIFWPQNMEYTSVSELVKIIAVVNGKKVVLIRGMEMVLKVLSRMSGRVNKAFGNLSYDKDMSAYREAYQKVSLEESIRKTEI